MSVATTGKGYLTMSEIKPKPCPFCGSSDVDACPEGERADGKPWYVYYVHCNNCVCDGPLITTNGYNVTHDAARKASIDLWNWRVK